MHVHVHVQQLANENASHWFDYDFDRLVTMYRHINKITISIALLQFFSEKNLFLQLHCISPSPKDILCYDDFFCLFGVFRPTQEFFTHLETSPLPVKVCKLTNARHTRPLSSEVSLLCHTYWHTGHPFIMVFFEDPWHSHLMPSIWQWNCHYLFFNDLGLLRLGFELPTFRLRSERSYPLRHRRVQT